MLRIAAPEVGYSYHEALYWNVDEWEQVTGRNFEKEYQDYTNEATYYENKFATDYFMETGGT